MKQETAIRLINELYGKDMAERMLIPYMPLRNKTYKPRSWLQATFHVAAGGKPLFKFSCM